MLPRILLLSLLPACALASALPGTLTIEPQQSGVTSRLRGISAVSARVAWASGTGATVLRTIDGGTTWQARPIPNERGLDLRDVDAMSDRQAYVLSIGPGASSRIYKTVDGGERWTLQFQNSDPDVFLDAMAFWDADRGVAVSDSVRGAFVILTTNNGGRSWVRVPPAGVPAVLPSEGAFAASGTNVTVFGRDHAWFGTGLGRVLRTSDGGRSWKVALTPVRTGEATGIFSIAFRDTLHGVVVGGDYRAEAEAVDNVASTKDGGVTWTLAAKGLRGYRSVVAAVPGTKRSFVAAGPSGIDWSDDDGSTWAPAEGTGLDTLSVSKAGVGWGAGARGRLVRLIIRD
jgi:photosystem II stability/assembly factor-like uncharacterized protein